MSKRAWTDAQTVLLVKLWDEGALTQVQIGERLGVSGSAVSTRLREMRAAGDPRVPRRDVDRATAMAAKVAVMPRVDRDPCPRCGVRGDIGCAHLQVAA